MASEDDETLLEWAATNNRPILTGDVNTLIGLAIKRIQKNQAMPGVFAVHSDASMQTIIEDVILIAALGDVGEFEHRIVYLPM